MAGSNQLDNNPDSCGRENKRRRWFQVFLIALAVIILKPWISNVLISPPILQGVGFADGQPDSIEQVTCPFNLEGDKWTKCYRVYNLQNLDAPDGPVVSSLAVVVEPWGGATKADPFIYLEGGPGSAAIYADPGDFGKEGWARSTYELILSSGRSFIMIDTRGLGFAEPYLLCPRADRVAWRSLSKPPQKRDMKKITRFENQCFEAMGKRGVDFSSYNSAEVARDLVTLRHGLGVEQWNIYGVSYGAQTALQLLKADKHGVRSAIFDSPAYGHVTPWIDDEQAFARVLALLDEYCLAHNQDEDSHCPQGPNANTVSERLDRMLTLRARKPLLLRRPIWSNPVYLGDREAVTILHGLLYADDGFEAFLWDLEDLLFTKPSLFESFSSNSNYWHGLLDNNYNGSLYSWVVHDTTSCVEMDYSADQYNKPIVYGVDEIAAYRRQCTVMGLDYNGQNLRGNDFTDVPTLTFSGERDPITPPAYGRELAEDSKSIWWQQEQSGHGVLFWTEEPCVGAMAREFLETLDTNPQAHCDSAESAETQAE